MRQTPQRARSPMAHFAQKSTDRKQRSVRSMVIDYPRETPPHTTAARAQPPAAHRRQYSRPHHHRHGEHSPTAR